MVPTTEFSKLGVASHSPTLTRQTFRVRFPWSSSGLARPHGDNEMKPGHDGISDLWLERFLAEDLSTEDFRAVESQARVRRRLAQLARERAEFLASYPPDRFASNLAIRLARDGTVLGALLCRP